MTSGRFWLCGGAIAVSLTLASAPGCSGGGLQPCDATTCAPIEGRYTLSFEDGGFNDTGACGQLPVELPDGPLTLSRSVAQLTGTVEGLTLSGTLYNNNEFSLLGTGPTGGDAGFNDSRNLSFSGTYIPPRAGRPTVGDGGTDGGTVDGGEAQLSGQFNGSRTRSGQSCQVTRRFTATRQP